LKKRDFYLKIKTLFIIHEIKKYTHVRKVQNWKSLLCNKKGFYEFPSKGQIKNKFGNFVSCTDKEILTQSILKSRENKNLFFPEFR